jgi:hypothetical protein
LISHNEQINETDDIKADRIVIPRVVRNQTGIPELLRRNKHGDNRMLASQSFLVPMEENVNVCLPSLSAIHIPSLRSSR